MYNESMERRKFIAAMSVLLLGAKSSAAKSLKLEEEGPQKASGGRVLDKLKSVLFKNNTYDLELPAKPKPIETIVTVKVELSRGKKLPRLVAKDNALINGDKRPYVIEEEGEFNIQYMSDECGWMVL